MGFQKIPIGSSGKPSGSPYEPNGITVEPLDFQPSTIPTFVVPHGT